MCTVTLPSRSACPRWTTKRANSSRSRRRRWISGSSSAVQGGTSGRSVVRSSEFLTRFFRSGGRAEVVLGRAYVRQYGYSVNQQFTGYVPDLSVSAFCTHYRRHRHGIGQRFHTAPWILHHGTLVLTSSSIVADSDLVSSVNDEPGVMRPGHCFTIEPCIVQGDWSRGYIWNDGWTFATEVSEGLSLCLLVY